MTRFKPPLYFERPHLWFVSFWHESLLHGSAEDGMPQYRVAEGLPESPAHRLDVTAHVRDE